VAAAPHDSVQVAVQDFTTQDPVFAQSTAHPLPAQSVVQLAEPAQCTVQPPAGQENEQVAPAGQLKSQPAPLPPHVWLHDDPVHWQAFPDTHWASSPWSLLHPPSRNVTPNASVAIIIEIFMLASEYCTLTRVAFTCRGQSMTHASERVAHG